MYVFIIFVLSLFIWTAVAIELIRIAIINKKVGNKPNSIVISLIAVAFSLMLNSLFIGLAGSLYFLGHGDVVILMIREKNWFLVRFLVVASGLFLLLSLRER